MKYELLRDIILQLDLERLQQLVILYSMTTTDSPAEILKAAADQEKY
jgi:hypothetical protein